MPQEKDTSAYHIPTTENQSQRENLDGNQKEWGKGCLNLQSNKG